MKKQNKVKRMTNKEYAKMVEAVEDRSPSMCPFCRKDLVEHVEEGEFVCNDCGRSWMGEFKCSGYTEFK